MVPHISRLTMGYIGTILIGLGTLKFELLVVNVVESFFDVVL